MPARAARPAARGDGLACPPNRFPKSASTVSSASAAPPNRSSAATVCGTCSTTDFELEKALPHNTIVINSSRYGLLGVFVLVME